MTASSLRTTDVLLHVIVSLLTPMFLTTTGNVNHAYAAAEATVRSCTARHPMDLLLIGQMIALSLATLSSVSLSMEDNIPIRLILRLRGNAVSLHRASEKCRRALLESEPNPAIASDAPLAGAELQHETEIITEQPHAAPASERHAGKAAATPTATLFNPEQNLRTACTAAFPDATQAEIDAIIKQAMSESRAENMHATAPNLTVSHPINSTPPPPGFSRAPAKFPDIRGAA